MLVLNKFIFLFLGLLFLYIFSQILIQKTVQNKEIVEINNQEVARVLRVIDGDTIEVLINNKEDTVRLIGIDSPETLDSRKPVQCFGKEASNKAKEMLSGKTIRLEPDTTQSNRDKYGRLLRYVFLNNLNFNKFMISEGFVHEYTYQNNPYKHMEEFKNAERIAREEKKGLWKENVCKTP